MRLVETEAYAVHGLDADARLRLGALGDVILGAGLNVTGIREPHEIERIHFLDSLSVLSIPCVSAGGGIVDVGSGAGLPALVLAIALPSTMIVALESQHKKCGFISRAARELSLSNVTVCCERAEAYGRGEGRERYHVAISRAVASVPVVAEYSLPLVTLGGCMVALKGAISDQEWIQADKAIGILGGDSLDATRLQPFPDAQNRWAYIAKKVKPTPSGFPRRPGVPAKRPLGG